MCLSSSSQLRSSIKARGGMVWSADALAVWQQLLQQLLQ
jgi:hypothetical protein